MGKPRSLTQALSQGFVIKNIYGKGNKQIRLDMERRFYKPDSLNSFSLWIDRDYFKRNYPNTYDKFSY